MYGGLESDFVLKAALMNLRAVAMLLLLVGGGKCFVPSSPSASAAEVSLSSMSASCITTCQCQ